MRLPKSLLKALSIVLAILRRFARRRKELCLELALAKAYRSMKIRKMRYFDKCIEASLGDIYVSKYGFGGICLPPDTEIMEYVATAIRYLSGMPKAFAIYVRVPTDASRCDESVKVAPGFRKLASFVEKARKLGFAIEIDGRVVSDAKALAYPPVEYLAIMNKSKRFIEVLYLSLKG